MLQVGICDDEIQEIEKLRIIVEGYLKEQKVTFQINTYLSGKKLLESKITFDILFLDIFMPEQDGFVTARELIHDRTTKIIYVTNAKEYIYKAINSIHAFAFLDKPISEKTVIEQLEAALFDIRRRESVREKRTFITKLNGIIEFVVDDIYYIEYFNRKITLCTRQGQYICKSEKINSLAVELERFDFAMPHQSYVVNLFYVNGVYGNEIQIRNGDILPLAQKRAAVFRKLLLKTAQKNMDYLWST